MPIRRRPLGRALTAAVILLAGHAAAAQSRTTPESVTGRERLPAPWVAGDGVSRREHASPDHRPRRETGGGADDGGSGAARVPRRLVAITRPDPHQHVPHGPAAATTIFICICVGPPFPII